ncbi:MAG: OmpA family protein [Treponema sp.]|nr:OmpA family protein [Treponema sp.]
MRRNILFVFIIGITIVTAGFTLNDGLTPQGGTTARELFSPAMTGGGGFITSRGGAPASALNPAAEGEAQRIIFNLGYLGLPRFDEGVEYGLGAFNLGATFPTRYAVFGASLWYLNSPFDSFPLGNTFRGNLNIAKEIYPGMSAGAGFNIGYQETEGMNFSGDLGFRYNMGTLGPLDNFTWAITASSLGTSWVPTMLTPAAGLSFDLLNVEGEDGRPNPIKMTFYTDLVFPTVQNIAGNFGLSFLIAELVSVSASTRFNLRESLVGSGPNPFPSIGVGLNLKLSPGRNNALLSDGELAIDIGARPLYDGIWAAGAGAAWTVGFADNNPPRIIPEYPVPSWISPNNDGILDYLEFPISIIDERYVMEWTFEISDEGGAVVRTLRNREIRPETQGVQNIIQRLLAVKSGVEVPPSLRWDGSLDSGGIAGDGRYSFIITAMDDSGNTSRTGPFEVNVRNTPPNIVLEPFTGDLNIFAPGGTGGRDNVSIGQTGSDEELWEAGIYDIMGVKLRNFDIQSGAPGEIVWDGTDDEGIIVPDGVYNYRISSTDRAGNTSSAALENIIVNTIRPLVGLTIADSHFSPNRDGVKDTMILNLSVPVTEGITGWELAIRDFSGAVRRTYRGSATVPGRIEFDGYDEERSLLPEAIYSANLQVRYRNGHLSSANSPNFTLDITPPFAEVQIEDRDVGPGMLAVFSPNNTGIKDELILIQEGSIELSWTGEVRRADDDSLVRTFRFTGTPPRRHTWDGITNAGALAPDGFYTYELFSIDQAGNTGRSNIVRFELNTRDTPIFISTSLRAFSPNGDGIRDTIDIVPQVQETEGILNWRVEILNIGPVGAGPALPVRSFEGIGTVPPAINWDGRTNTGTIAGDGTYLARFDVEYRAGSRPTALSLAFGLRTTPPFAEASIPFNIFAPNGNGNRDMLPIYVVTEGNDEWDALILDSNDNLIKYWNWTGRAPGVAIPWDGTDAAGNIVPDGIYNFILSSTDEAGNSTLIRLSNIEVDARVPGIFLTSSAQAIAPRQDQNEAIRFNIVGNMMSGVSFYRMGLLDEDNTVARAFPEGSNTLPSFIPWNGANEQGRIQEGQYTPIMTIVYEKGDMITISAPPVLVDVSGPVLGFRSEPEFFSPDNDGVDDELFMYLSAIDASPIAEWSLEIRETEGTRQLFYSIGGRGTPAERLIWDGRSNWGELVQSATDYEYIYTAVDTLGNASTINGLISTDVLVIRDGDILRIQIPSITFRANHADFIGIPQDRLENNNRVLRRVAEILNRFRDYRITVEGHANPVLGTEREETMTLMPLSLARAQFVIDYLAGTGVSRARLSPIGRGGSINIANPGDQDNSWKNRRVEFLLIR